MGRADGQRSSLGLDVNAIFTPVVPAMVAGLGWVLFVSYLMGKRERERLGVRHFAYDFKQELSPEESASKRPKLFWFNLVFTIVTVIALVKAWFPLPIVFMVAFAVALLVNYPDPQEQQVRLRAQATGMVTVVSIIFAAGIFSGILSGTGMIVAMAQSLVAVVPEQAGGWMALLVAVTSMPLSLIFTPDAYYFGVLPILAQTAGMYGVESVEVARAAILGQMTTGFPLSPLTASTFLLVGLAGVELGDHQKFIFKWAFATTIIMTVVAWITGAISI